MRYVDCLHSFSRFNQDIVQGIASQNYSHLETIHGDNLDCTSKL